MADDHEEDQSETQVEGLATFRAGRVLVGTNETPGDPCLLNRKPYRDRHGNLRERTTCMKGCSSRNDRRTCTLTKQPEGVIIKAATNRKK